MRTFKKLIFYVFLAVFPLGCAHTSSIEKADLYKQKSQDFFVKAVGEYGNALNSKDSNIARFKLGNLYYQNGQYLKAIEQLKMLPTNDAQKLLVLCYYKIGDYTQALSLFNKLGKVGDDEYLYYYGLTCERQNLFEQALELYSKIKEPDFERLARERITAIEAGGFAALDEKTKKIIENSPSQEQYPQAGAVILSVEEEAQILPDNTTVFSGHFLVKILNERGKNAFSEIVIDYDSTFEKVDLEFARTINPEGKITYAGKRHIRDVSKYMNFPLYSNARAVIVSMPDITEGAIVEYKVKISRSNLVNKRDYETVYSLQGSEPIIYASFKLTLPKDRNINQKIINEEYNKFGASLKPDIKQDGQNKTYFWEFKNIPKIIPEPAMPPEAKINTMILLSTFNSWNQIYNWWRSLAKDKIEITDEIKKKTEDLMQQCVTQEDKVRAIYNFVVQDIRYVAIEYGQAGHEPHRASLVFANKYGDCKDKAVLLVSMLKAAGIKSYLVLIGTRDVPQLCEDFPTILFNHCIAVADIGGRLVFLDGTAETTSFGDLPFMDQGRKVLVFFPDKQKILVTPSFPPDHNKITYKTEIKINKDETVSGSRQVDARGYYESSQRSWLKNTMPVLVEETLRQKVREFTPDAELLNHRIENLDDLNKHIKLNFQFQGKGFFFEAGNARVLPALGSSPDTSLTVKDKRQYPIELLFTDKIETIVKIDLPENLDVKYLPDPIFYNTAWIEFKREYLKEGKNILFKETKITKKTRIGQKEYQQFKKFSEKLAQKTRQAAILTKE